MSEYKLKPGKIGKAVVEGYKKVEGAFVETFLEKSEEGDGLQMKTGKIGQAVVDGYKKMENSVVGGYKKIEGAFVEKFLEKVDDPDSGVAGDHASQKDTVTGEEDAK